MAGNPLHTVLDHLRQLHRIADASQHSDGELLHAFTTNNDQDAFAAVVTRHASLVWGVCRRILGHHQDAEDAFQATFLALARRAGSVRWQTSIGGWLHTVAQRLAVRLRKQTEQRRIHECEANRMPPADASLRELAAVVDEELQRLPAKYREPLLLHYLEGMTAEAAARQLGLSRTVFYDRLTYGRELLRERLSRQGLSLTAPLLAAALTPETEAASRLLIQTTIHAALGSAPQRVAALAAEAVGTTAMTKLKIGLALGLLLGVAAGGVEMLTSPAAMDPISPTKERPAEPPKDKDKSAVLVDRHGDPLPPGAVARLGTLRFRVDAEIIGLAFAADGKTIAVRGNGNVWLLDAVSGKQIRRIDRTRALIPGIAFSPDGKQLIAPCHAGESDRAGQVVKFRQVVRVWETASARKAMESELDKVCWVGWSADGHPLAAYLGEGEMRLRDLGTGRERRFPAKDFPVLNPTGVCSCVVAKNVLAASDDNCIVHVWDRANGKERCLLKAGDGYVRSMALTADGRLLAALAQDVAGAYLLQLWDTSTGVAVHRIASEQRHVDEVVFSPDGQTLATLNWDDIRLWDAKTGRERGRIQTEGRTVQFAAFSHDGKTLATAERYSGTIHLWDMAKARMKPEREGHTNRPRRPSFSPDGTRVATSSSDNGTIFIWNSATGEPLTCIQRLHLHDSVFLADGRTLCSCGQGNKLHWHDAIGGRELHALEVEDPDRPKVRQSGLSLHLSDDRARLIVLSSDANREMLLTGWDAAARKQFFHRRRQVQEPFYSLSADARMLAAPRPAADAPKRQFAKSKGSVEQALQLEDVATGEQLLTFPRPEGQTLPLAFSPDGRLLVSNTNGPVPQATNKSGRTLRLWEVLTAKELLVMSYPGKPSFIRAAFSADGRVLALSAPSTEILLWDVRRGKELHRFKDFDAQVTSLTFSPDGRRLVSGLSDSTLLVWDVAAPPATVDEKLGADGAAKAWADLAADDAPRAFRTRGILASAPSEAMPLLLKHLHPVESADPRFRRLLNDLDSQQFAVREKAQEELVKLGDLAEAALRRTLANKPSLEMRRRVQTLLERLRGPVKQPELLQALRAVAVLEDIGTSEARRLLEELTKGAAEARLTREAKESLRRLNLRSTSPSRDR